jgi:hypothetical protein
MFILTCIGRNQIVSSRYDTAVGIWLPSYCVFDRYYARIPCSSGAGGVGSIPANPDAQNVPSFRRWRFEMKLSPFYYFEIPT